jgi:hypothetical protein
LPRLRLGIQPVLLPARTLDHEPSVAMTVTRSPLDTLPTARAPVVGRARKVVADDTVLLPPAWASPALASDTTATVAIATSGVAPPRAAAAITACNKVRVIMLRGKSTIRASDM